LAVSLQCRIYIVTHLDVWRRMLTTGLNIEGLAADLGDCVQTDAR
jgi:hypothetical protein